MAKHQKYKIIVSYEGTRYKGWQKLKQTPDTVQGKLESVLSRVFGRAIQIDGASRTDAGVHAKAQVASFTADERDCSELMTEINRYLPTDIAVIALERANQQFHARFNAVEKTYHYTVWRAEYPPVFERNFVTVITAPLDIAAMREAAKLLSGKRDFKGFSSDKTKKSTIRYIRAIEICEHPETITFVFKGDGFLYNMVRILVGTLLEIGEGKRTIDSINAIFETKSRALAGETAPANGLCLMEVVYKK